MGEHGQAIVAVERGSVQVIEVIAAGQVDAARGQDWLELFEPRGWLMSTGIAQEQDAEAVEVDIG